MSNLPPPAPLRFGAFDVSATGGLRKCGVPVRLSGQPFQILLVLLAHPGDLISREQLRQAIWPSGTFVDFDHGLNAAVNKLRRALDDSADSPRYIETVPGRGYRFIGAIDRRLSTPIPNAPIISDEPVHADNPLGLLSVGCLTAADQQEGNLAIDPDKALKGTQAVDSSNQSFLSVSVGSNLESRPRNPIAKGFGKTGIAATASIVVSLFAAFYFYLHYPPRLSGTDRIVLADFQNMTGDPVFDIALRQGLAAQLEQSPFLSLISDRRIQTALRLMQRPADSRLDPQLAREICVRTSSAVVLEGSIVSLGTQFVLALRATSCTGEVFDEEQVQAARKEDVLNALSQIALRFRTKAGESLSVIQKHETPLAEATTPSLEALQAYSLARKIHSLSTGSARSLPLYLRALEIDPAFAMAHAWLAQLYGEIGESDLAAENASFAYRLRNRASDTERFFIDITHDTGATGNMESARKTCELWAQTYPRDANPHAFLGGIIYPTTGNLEKAAEECRRSIELDPDFTLAYNILARSYVRLDRLAEAEQALRQASARKLDIPHYADTRSKIAFLRGENPAPVKPGTENEISSHQVFSLAYSGHLREANLMAIRGGAIAEEHAERERAALFQTGSALRAAFFGYPTEAIQAAMAALKLSKDREVEYGAAFAFALSDDFAQAKKLMADLQKRFGEDTSVRFSYLPALRALVALHEGNPGQAIQLLQITEPYDRGTPGSMEGSFGALYPVYVRGNAYLAANRGTEAAAEFQKILDHRGIVLNDPIGALAHWKLGQALGLSGDSKAKTAYRDFFTLWKEADPGIPVLKRAQAEYVKLR